MDTMPNSNPSERWLHDLWLNTRWLPPAWDDIDALPGGDLQGSDTIHIPRLDTNPLEIYLEIYQRRIARREFISAVIDEPDFQPIDFLRKGLKQGNAVCRISAYFSAEELWKAVQTFKESVELLSKDFQEIEEHDSFFNAKRELKSIFSNSSSIIDEILKDDNIRFLEALETLASRENIGKLTKLNPIPIGTGFLVGGSQLLTNHHVIPDRGFSEYCVAQFSPSKISPFDDIDELVSYDFDPGSLFISNPTLDYTLIQLKSGKFKQSPGYDFGWIYLIEFEDIIAPGLNAVQIQELIDSLKKKGFSDKQLEAQGLVNGKESILGDPVIIVQHPRGQKTKQIVLRDNSVTQLSWQDLDYRADTQYGSSGSPVFNMDWKLVALTKKVVAKESIANRQEEFPNQEALARKNVNQNQDLFRFVASRGTRVCRIIEDLKCRSYYDSKLKNFIENFVITAEEFLYPPLPGALEFNGTGSYVNLSSQQESASVAFVTASNEGDFTVRNVNTRFAIWNPSGSEIASFSVPNASVESVGFSPDSRLLAIALYLGNNSIIQIWELDKLLNGFPKPLFSWIADDYGVSRLTFSPDGETLATSHGMSPVLKLWKILDGGEVVKEVKTYGDSNQWFRDQSFSFDQKFLATAGTESLKIGKICVWSLSNLQNEGALQLLDSKTAHGDMAWTVSFSPQGNSLASGGRDGKIGLWTWNENTLELLKFLEGHTDQVLKVSFSPDGNILASASADKTIKLWNKDGQLLRTLEGHTDQVRSIEFNLDGQTLISASEDKTAKVWSTDGKLLYSLNLSSSPQVSFNPSVKLSQAISDPETAEFYYSFGGTEPFSIEAWVNPIRSGSESVILSKAHGLDQGEYILYITKEGNIVFSRFSGSLLETRQATVTFGVFNHIAATYDGINMKVYVNGGIDKKIKLGNDVNPEKDEQGNIKPPIPYDFESGARSANPSLPLLLGTSLSRQAFGEVGFQTSQTSSNFFKGIIAEVRVWKKALTEADIRSNMFQRLYGTEIELRQIGLTGYWRFEESETDLKETVVNHVSPSRSKGLAFDVRRLAASGLPSLPLPFGLFFDGESSYVNCGDSKELKITKAITVEAWVRYITGDGLIVYKGGGWKKSGYCLFWHQGRIRVELQNIEKGKKTTVDTKNCAPDDFLWHHIAFTWDQESEEIEIYIDAHRQDVISVGSANAKSRFIDGSYKNVGVFKESIGKSNQALYIGRNEGGQDEERKVRYFNGAIAEVRLWKIARSQGKIKAYMSRRLGEQDPDWRDLVGYWRLDDGGQDNVARNLKSDSNSGVVHGAKPFPPPPPSLPTGLNEPLT